MSLWENNPMGLALAGACGVLILLGVTLNLAWRGPVSSDSDALEANVKALPPLPPAVEELGPMGDYEEVNNRPLFSETRRPEVLDIEVVEQAPEPVIEEVVAEPPDVRLTGVVITPTQKVVTLTPAAGGEAVVIREGMPLDGEFVGWSVDTVAPRAVSLRSSKGQTINVELAVHDAMIEAPPPPQPSAATLAARAAEAVEPEGVEAADGTQSRADEIRERIRQRREQLRAEAEQEAVSEDEQKASTANAYQDAIRAMMQRNRQPAEEEAAEDEDSGE